MLIFILLSKLIDLLLLCVQLPADLNASAEAPTSLLEAPPSTAFASSTSSSLQNIPVLDNDLEGVGPVVPSSATEQRNTSEGG